MKLLSLEHKKAAYMADLILYGVANVILASVLVTYCPRDLRLKSVAMMMTGLLGWTLLEYLLHRFVLHGMRPFSDWHRQHHQRPTALICTPTIVSAPLFVVLVFLPAWSLSDAWLAGALTLGLLIGYLMYSVTHHALHHWHGINSRWFSQRRRCHALHHGKNAQNCHYGVTSALWDHILGSYTPVSHSRTTRRPGF